MGGVTYIMGWVGQILSGVNHLRAELTTLRVELYG